MPNDAEWECVDMDGVTFCHGRGDAAGIVPAPIELGWLCGDGPAGPVCVDFDADRPPLEPSYRCRIVYPHGVPERHCTRAVAARVGSPCDASVRCPAASSCQDGLCLPARPAPSCWFDAHCGNAGVCRWGTCQ